MEATVVPSQEEFMKEMNETAERIFSKVKAKMAELQSDKDFMKQISDEVHDKLGK